MVIRLPLFLFADIIFLFLIEIISVKIPQAFFNGTTLWVSLKIISVFLEAQIHY